jgi:hypothetical protein
LQSKHSPAGERGFFRVPVQLSGSNEALLLNGGFSLPDDRAVAAAIKASGKTQITIYISQSDPDYDFSLGPIQATFPGAKVAKERRTGDERAPPAVHPKKAAQTVWPLPPASPRHAHRLRLKTQSRAALSA